MSLADTPYTAPKVVSQFMRSNAEFKAILGPFGSGKSVGCCMQIMRRCMEQRVGTDGFRRSRWVIVRNVRQQLQDTTIKTWLDWIPDGVFGRWKESKMEYHIQFNDVKAEILFRALDTPADVNKLMSLELTGIWFNEAQYIPQEIVEKAQGRLKRYPSVSMGGSNYWETIADTNPPAIGTYWHKVFEHIPIVEGDNNSIALCDTFKQPSGLDPDADNLENLDPTYYSSLAKGKSQAYIDVVIKALYPASQDGKPVYHATFKRDRHVSITPLPIDPILPIIVGQDWGLTPAGLWMQMQLDGRIFILRETPAFDMGTKRYIKTKFRPMHMAAFPLNPIIVIGDPAGVRRSDSDEGTCFKEFKDAGYMAKPSTLSSNDPDVRIKSLDDVFSEYPDGEPRVLIDPSCKSFIAAMASNYKYKKKKNSIEDKFDDKPDKTQPCSHLVEGGQYGMLFLTGKRYDPGNYTVYGDDPMGYNTRPIHKPATSAGY